MLTKSIRLTDDEARELEELVRQSGEVEASLLKRAALRGLREDRLDRAVLLYLHGAGVSEAATLARLPHARFIDLLAERGILLLEGPSSMPEELDLLARLSGDSELAEVAEAVRSAGPVGSPTMTLEPRPVSRAARRRPRR